MRRSIAAWLALSLCAPQAWGQTGRAARPVPVVPVHTAPGFAPTAAPVSLTNSAVSLPSLPTLAAPASISPAAAVAPQASAVAAPAAAAFIPAVPQAAVAEGSLLPAAAAAEAAAAFEPTRSGNRETSTARLRALSLTAEVEPLWTGGVRRGADAGAVAARTSGRARPSLLAASPLAANAVAEPARAPEPIAIPERSWSQGLKDWLHYAQITGSSLWWYTFPRLVERWNEVAESLEKSEGKPRAVRSIMGFFIAHRVLGSTGSYAPMGFRVAANQVVVDDAWRIYDAYFADDAASRAAFGRLIARSLRFNPNRRSTQFRKIVFHALREAATMDPAAVPAFFDSLATDEKAAALADYQATAQPRILARFETLANAVILELNASLPAGRRVVGAVLLGSFANGAAGPGSDLDLQTISEDGGASYNEEFLKRLKARWKAEGVPSHPVSGFEYGLPLSKDLITRVHHEPYMVVSPYPEVVAALAAAPGEMKDADMKRGVQGLAFVWAYSALLAAVLMLYEGWRRLVRRLA
ncbi:MAG: nucleotidyltransferase domain-containing protein [Elusimicrobia bacterium]|nr:nucleotidyltransferase domain-containing protein [Elusimicrobiota bacterium]